MKAKILKAVCWKGKMLSAGDITEVADVDVKRLPEFFQPASVSEQSASAVVPAKSGEVKSASAKVDKMIRQPKIKKARK